MDDRKHQEEPQCEAYGVQSSASEERNVTGDSEDDELGELLRLDDAGISVGWRVGMSGNGARVAIAQR